jgi:hypothetical protein
MSSLLIPVIIGLAVGIGLIIAFAIYLAPSLNPISDQDLYERNLAKLSADADCTAAECAFTVITQCEISQKVVVSKEGYYVWIIQGQRNDNETCEMEFTEMNVLSVESRYGDFITHDCRIPSEVLAESQATSINELVDSVLADERTRCGISMP